MVNATDAIPFCMCIMCRKTPRCLYGKHGYFRYLHNQFLVAVVAGTQATNFSLAEKSHQKARLTCLKQSFTLKCAVQ